MLPSSRTPEGHSAECAVCGAISNVLISDPPRDSVCPSCGSYLHQIGEPNSTPIRDKIRSFLSEISLVANDAHRRQTLPSFLTRNLTSVTAAFGASVWRFDRDEVTLIESFGEQPDFGQINRVRVQECAIIERDLFASRLFISVPMTELGRAIGGIQIGQRNVESPFVQRGYSQFLTTVATLASNAMANLN